MAVSQWGKYRIKTSFRWNQDQYSVFSKTKRSICLPIFPFLSLIYFDSHSRRIKVLCCLAAFTLHVVKPLDCPVYHLTNERFSRLQEYGAHTPVNTATLARRWGRPFPQTATLDQSMRIGHSGARCTAAPATPSRALSTGVVQVGLLSHI